VVEIIRGIGNLRERHHGAVVSIGNFDGVHRGHQAIVERLLEEGRRLDVPTVAVTFEPHPLEFFAGSEAPPRIMTFRQKVEALADLGVDRVLCLRFNRELANTMPEDFVRRILVNGLGVRHVLVGDDFRFGRDRGGDFSFLEQCGTRFGFGVSNTPTIRVADERISSSAIRICLAKGDFPRAQRLLGRPWQVSGHIAHGDKRGREWGFPTINLYPRWHRPPVTGIFAVRVSTAGGLNNHPGAGYIGRRPVIKSNKLVVEVNLLDFDGDLYGQRATVNFVAKIRDDRHFEKPEELEKQMRQDVLDIERHLGV